MPTDPARLRPRLIVFAGVIFTSFSSIFVRLSDAPSLAIAFYRMLFASLMVLPLFVRDRHRLRRDRGAETGVSPSRKDYLLCIASGVFLAVHFATWIHSLSLTSIASAAILVNTHPVFVLVASYLLYREKVSRRGLTFVAVVLAGSVLLSLGDSARGTNAIAGNLLAVAGAVSVGGYMLIGRFVRQRMSATEYVFWVYTTAAAALAVMIAVSKVRFYPYAPREYLIFIGLAFFCSILGHTVFNWALKYLRTTYVSTAILSEPVYATLMGIAIFNEIPGWVTLLGGLVVLMGLFGFTRADAADAQRS